MTGFIGRHGGWSLTAFRAFAGRLCAVTVLTALTLVGTAPWARAGEEWPQPLAWVEIGFTDLPEPAAAASGDGDLTPRSTGRYEFAPAYPDPGYYPGDRESPSSTNPLTADQDARLREAADFYLRDGSPGGSRAYLVYARHIVTGGPSTQDWIDAAKHVGGFVVQTTAAVVAVAGCPATSGATCLIATALANGAGSCLDGCGGTELAINVVAIGVAVKAGYAINSIGLNPTEAAAQRLVTNASIAESVASADWAAVSGILRGAAAGKGNFGLGAATQTQARIAGQAWVGDGARLASDGKTLLSRDGLRQWRPPSYKPKLGTWQSNFESRWKDSGMWQSNGHLDITDLP